MFKQPFPLASASLACLISTAGCSPAEVSYTKQVSSILRDQCAECHLQGGKGAVESGFLVESYDSVMAGTKYGSVIVPGSSVSSSLYRLVAGKVDPSIQMPHGKNPLTDEQVGTIKRWIDQGAKKG